MATRSDVGIVIVSEFIPELEKIFEKYDMDPDETRNHEMGNAYLFRDIKWFDEIPFTKEVIEFLSELDLEHFQVIEIDLADLSNEEGDLGGWYDNPFNMRRMVTVALKFN